MSQKDRRLNGENSSLLSKIKKISNALVNWSPNTISYCSRQTFPADKQQKTQFSEWKRRLRNANWSCTKISLDLQCLRLKFKKLIYTKSNKVVKSEIGMHELNKYNRCKGCPWNYKNTIPIEGPFWIWKKRNAWLNSYSTFYLYNFNFTVPVMWNWLVDPCTTLLCNWWMNKTPFLLVIFSLNSSYVNHEQ